MTLRQRLERAKATARLAGKFVGVAGTIVVLGVLWVALHRAEDEWLEVASPSADADA
jgi:hypothetical protein